MTLETKSIHDLRAIAQALNVKFKWEDSRLDLLKAIEESATQHIKPDDPVAQV